MNFSHQSRIVLASLNRPTTICFQPSTTCNRKHQHTNNDMFWQTATNLQRNVFTTHDHVFADSNQPTNINQSATNELFAHAATKPTNDWFSQAASHQPTAVCHPTIICVHKTQTTDQQRRVFATNQQTNTDRCGQTTTNSVGSRRPLCGRDAVRF